MIQDYLSPSRIGTFLRCQFQFNLRYLEMIPVEEGASEALLLGKALDHAMSEYYRKKMKGTKIPLSDTIVIYSNYFDEEFKRMQLLEDQRQELTMKGIKMLEIFYQSFSDIINPISIQEELRTEIQIPGSKNIPIFGIADIIDNDTVYDIKTTGKSPGGQFPYMHWFQLVTYAMITNKPKIAGLYCLSLKTPRVEIIQMEVKQRDIQHVKRIYHRVYNNVIAIENGTAFAIPNRSSELCSEKFCDFSKHCKDYWGGIIKSSKT